MTFFLKIDRLELSELFPEIPKLPNTSETPKTNSNFFAEYVASFGELIDLLPGNFWKILQVAHLLPFWSYKFGWIQSSIKTKAMGTMRLSLWAWGRYGPGAGPGNGAPRTMGPGPWGTHGPHGFRTLTIILCDFHMSGKCSEMAFPIPV